jgi:hypothetical protein
VIVKMPFNTIFGWSSKSGKQDPVELDEMARLIPARQGATSGDQPDESKQQATKLPDASGLTDASNGGAAVTVAQAESDGDLELKLPTIKKAGSRTSLFGLCEDPANPETNQLVINSSGSDVYTVQRVVLTLA